MYYGIIDGKTLGEGFVLDPLKGKCLNPFGAYCTFQILHYQLEERHLHLFSSSSCCCSSGT